MVYNMFFAGAGRFLRVICRRNCGRTAQVHTDTLPCHTNKISILGLTWYLFYPPYRVEIGMGCVMYLLYTFIVLIMLILLRIVLIIRVDIISIN